MSTKRTILTDEQRAEAYRELAYIKMGEAITSDDLYRMARSLDPPKLAPGTFIQWMWVNGTEWKNGIVSHDGKGVRIPTGSLVRWENIKEWRGVNSMSLAENEEIVKIPKFFNWPTDATHAELRWHYLDDEENPYMSDYAGVCVSKKDIVKRNKKAYQDSLD